MDAFLEGKVDVLIGSSAISTGLDGLQSKYHTLIFLSLPWTGSAFEQTVGRLRRQNGAFERVDVLIPQILFTIGDQTWSWDRLRMEVIESKRTLCDCVLDGQLPSTLGLSSQALLKASRDALKQWIKRVQQQAHTEPSEDESFQSYA